MPAVRATQLLHILRVCCLLVDDPVTAPLHYSSCTPIAGRLLATRPGSLFAHVQRRAIRKDMQGCYCLAWAARRAGATPACKMVARPCRDTW